MDIELISFFFVWVDAMVSNSKFNNSLFVINQCVIMIYFFTII